MNLGGYRTPICWMLLPVLLCVLALGCKTRRLNWQYVDTAPEQVSKAHRVAFTHRITGGSKSAASINIADAITAELLARKYRVATREADADLVLDFSTHLTQQTVTSTTTLPLPIVHKSRTKSEVKETIRQISYNIISPEDRTIVGRVTVEFTEPIDNARDAVRDALLGLEMISRGRAPATVKLKGKPGQAP